MSDKIHGGTGVKAGSVSVSLPIRLLKASDGTGVTAKLATNLTASYWRQGGTRTAIVLRDLAAVDSAYSSGGVKEIDATNVPGVYRLDVPNAAFAAGADWAVLSVVCSGAMDYIVFVPLESVGASENYARVGAPSGVSVVADIATRLASASYTAPPTVGEIATAVWASASRTLTSFGALVADVWANATRTLSAFGFSNEIDTQLSSTHGAGAWGASGASGEYTVTLTLRNAATLATLRDVLVTVKNSGDTTTLDQKRTSAAGVVTLSLDAATYTLHASLPGYQTLSQSLVIAGNTTSNVDLTAIAVGEPTNPSMCRVYGYLYLNGEPLAGATVTVQLTGLPQTTTAVVLDGASVSNTTDADGYFALDLVRTKKYMLGISSAGISKSITVPDAVSVDVRTLIA